LPLVLAWLVIGVQPAAAWCNPNRTNDSNHHFDGWTANQNGATPGGAYGNITIYDPFVNYVNTSGWVMLNLNGTAWAQVGYLAKVGSPGPITGFTEYQALAYDHYEFPLPAGNPLEFKVLYENTPGEFTYFVNGSQKHWNGDGFVPNQAQNYGELQGISDQMLGAPNVHVFFSNMHVYFGSWQNFSGSTNSDIFGLNWDSTSQIEIWESATVCSS
jgi:hypothetical protein